MSQSVLKSEVLLPQFYVFMKPYFFCPKIHLSLFLFVITRDILWFFELFLKHLLFFCFSSFPVCSLVFSCLFFTFTLQIILSPFLALHLHSEFPFYACLCQCLRSVSQLPLYPVAGISTYIFLGISFLLVVESIGGFWKFLLYFPTVFTLFFLLCVFITLWSENEVERITFPIEYLDKLVNRKLWSIKMAFK